MADPSSWDRFVDSVERGITGPGDLESLDLPALRELGDADRERARKLCAGRLSSGDPRLVDALVEIGSDAAWGDVERAFTAGHGSAQVRAAWHLWRRNRDSRVVPSLRKLAAKFPDAPSLLEETAFALAQVDDPSADEALLELLGASKVARLTSYVTDRLFVRHAFDQYEFEATPIFTLRCGLTSLFPSVRAPAIEELRRLLARRRAGETDDQLGIVAGAAERSPQISELLRSVFDPKTSIDLANLDALSGGERDWAIDLLLGPLEDGDERVIAALEHLGGERARLALADHRSGRRLR